MVNMYSVSSGSYGFYIWINNGRSQLVVTQGTTGSEVYNVYTGTSTVTTGAWENIVWYFDMASFANTRCYKNGVSQSLTQSSFNGTLSLNFNSIATVKIGQKNTAQSGTGTDYNGKLAQVYVNAVTAEPSINYFWDNVVSLPKDLGTNGTATGLPQPYVYHYGTTSTFVHNLGVGLNQYVLTANGNIADATGLTYPTLRTANTVTAYGNAKVSTAQSVFGGASALFDGTTDYLQTGNTTNLDLGSGDFTIEFRIRFNAVDALYVPICQRAGTGIAAGEWWCEVTAAEDEMYWGFRNTAGTQYYVNLSFAASAFAINTWYHIALVRYNNNLQLYQAGSAVGSATAVTGSFGTGGNITIGALGQSSFSLNGYMDEIRISNVARYTGNFTVPTQSFVNDRSTLLLIHADGTNNSTTFTDDIGNTRTAVTLTANGNAQISTAQSKFGGSSGLFDGTGDYVSMSSIQYPGVDTFTIEGHFRITNNTTRNIIAIWHANIGLSNNRHSVYLTGPNFSGAANRIYISLGSGGSYSFPFVSYTVTLNTWFHLAISRDGSNNIRFFINGTQQGTTQTDSKVFFPSSAATARIGSNTYENGDMFGYFDEFRISSVARYTANFTTPTEPFVNDSSTLLLIHANGANASTTFTDDNS